MDTQGDTVAITATDYSKTKHTGIKIHKDSVQFLFDIRVDGKRYRKMWEASPTQGKTDRLKSAYSNLELFRKETEHKQSITANIDATINEYWEILQDTKKEKWSAHWMLNNTKFYDKYIRNLLGTKRIREVKPAMLTQFNKTISHLSPRTQKTAYELLNPIFNLSIEDEIIDRSPVKQSHIPKRKQLEEKKIVTDAVTKYKAVHKAIHKVFGTDQVITFEDGTTLQCNIDPHYRALFLFGFYGRRKTEVLDLQWDDINFTNNTYCVKAESSKVNLDMTFQLPQDAKDALLEFKNTTGRVFNVRHIERHYKKIRNLTGIQEFTFHWMRNLSVSALSSMGVEITHLSAMLGHTDSGTIRKYLSLQREASTAVTNEASQRLLS